MFIFLPTRINYTLHSCLSQQLLKLILVVYLMISCCFAQQINTIQTYPRFNNSKNYTIKRQSKSLQKKSRTFFLIEFNYKRIIQKKILEIKLKRLYKPYSQTLFLLFILKYFYYFSIIIVFIPNTLHLP